MSNYHGKVMNIRIDDEKLIDARDCAPDRDSVYRYGHRDARHVAAEIANEADTEIADLQTEIERLRAGGCTRDQGATQYCAEAQRWMNNANNKQLEIDGLKEAIRKLAEEFSDDGWGDPVRQTSSVKNYHARKLAALVTSGEGEE